MFYNCSVCLKRKNILLKSWKKSCYFNNFKRRKMVLSCSTKLIGIIKKNKIKTKKVILTVWIAFFSFKQKTTYSDIQVASYELRVESLKAKFKFKSASSNPRVTS